MKGDPDCNDARITFTAARQVQCVASPSGSASVISTTRSITSADSGGLPAGRVASCNKPSTPSAMKRACQRQMVGLPLPVCRWIAIVPTPSALSSTIRDRHTCFCGLFPDPITASSRSRSPGPRRWHLPGDIVVAEALLSVSAGPAKAPQAGIYGAVGVGRSSNGHCPARENIDTHPQA